MKLSQWAKTQGVTYKTAWNWFKNGQLPVNSSQLPSGTIIVDNAEKVKSNNDIVIYGRVSSYDKKNDLENQVKLCESFCAAKGWTVTKTFKEIASGMNDNRPKLNKIFSSAPSKLVVLHKDRLTRFGFNYVKEALSAKNCEIIVINENSDNEQDLLKDFIAVITSFCCRLYGARRGQSKALKIKETLSTA